MHPLNALALGLLAAVALMPRGDGLGGWRWVAAGAGALFPYSEVLLGLMGPGTLAQAYHGLTWSVALMPFYALALAGFLAATAEADWRKMLAPVAAGLATTWILGALTDDGVFPLALLGDWRLALGVLNGFDLVLLGLSVMGLVMVWVFPPYDRELARLSLGCVAVYLLLAGWWAAAAHRFGDMYAEAMRLDGAHVHALPQPLSPRNWRVMVVEGNGRIHTTLVNLARRKELDSDGLTGAARVEARYKPLDNAVWRIVRRYGDAGMGEDRQRRVRQAWYAWQATPFGWLGRYAVFDRFAAVAQVGPGAACVQFRDLRYNRHYDPARGVYVVCPAAGGRARMFSPLGAPDVQGEWKAVDELIPVMFARRR